MAACLASLLLGGDTTSGAAAADGAAEAVATAAPSLDASFVVETDEGLTLSGFSALEIFDFFVSPLNFCFAADSSLSISAEWKE